MDLKDLVLDDREAGVFRVRRSTMTSRDVYELEQRTIWDRCWLYLGHESEVPGIGDFVRREVAGRPLFFLRDVGGEVRVFFNSCPHRGARVCRQEDGTARTFQCFYHAWTFDTRGELIGLPDEEGFGPAFSRSDFGLRSPRHESYRGFLFVTFDRDAESLDDYLGAVTEHLDLVIDQSEIGMRVVPGMHAYGARANWKLMVENSLDGYHFLPVHETLTSFYASTGQDRSDGLKSGTAYSLDVGNGHTVTEHPSYSARPVALWDTRLGEDTREEIEQARRRLVERHGEARAARIAENGKTMLIYPNLVILDEMAPIVRTIWPAGVDEVEVRAWILAPQEESERLMAARLTGVELAVGPGGFATPDDIEAVEACQEGFRATDLEWSDISRGIGMPPQMLYEQRIRAFWREWHAHLQGRVHGDHTPDTLPLDREPAAAR